MLFTIQIIFRLPSTFMNHTSSVFMSPFAATIDQFLVAKKI